MENFDKSLLKKYFNNSTTAEEAEEVLDWFETPEGRDYLSEKIDSDIQSISDEKIHCRVTDIDSDKMLGAVRKRIKSKRHVPRRVYGVTKTVLRVAASALVILTASLFYYTAYDRQAPDAEEPTPAYYATSATEQKDVTLSDGTRIRLNSNSQIQLPVSLEEGRRGVVLTGEAYFDVAHDPERPFIIHTEESEIEVLGTSFNVKTSDSGKEVQVAVIEGSVSFGGRSETDGIVPVVLTGGQFAQMNSGDQTLRVEEFGVENYLVWMRGRLVFDDLSLNQACLQLNRLYGLECSYSEESLSEKRLTADFSPDSIEKSLSVISLSLDLDYERNGRKVTWFRVE